MIQKQVVETDRGPIVRVRFALPNSVWADRIHLVGDFDGWDRDAHPMQRGRDGGWQITLDLEPGRSFQFRYLCDGEHWMNDTQADGYAVNAFGTDNCIIRTDLPAAES